MHASAPEHGRVAPSAKAASAVAALYVDECDREAALVSIPRPEIQLVVRFGVSRNLDVHAMGVRRRVVRKLIGKGQRALTARLHFGAAEAVLGVPASTIADRVVALGDLWGDVATQRLLDRLAASRSPGDATAIMDGAIAERLTIGTSRRAHEELVRHAATRLTSASVSLVAEELGLSERHLRRVFRESVGVSPKAFTKLLRFRRALTAARETARPSWAAIAAATGYYDQAHLIDEFRAIAGVTPRALVDEMSHAWPARSGSVRR